MFVLSVLEAPNTKTNSLCVQTHWAIKFFPVLILIRVTNNLLSSFDRGCISLLVLLDLSTTFDTIDHNILLNGLENYVDIRGSALAWFKSYLSDCYQFVANGKWRGIIPITSTVWSTSRLSTRPLTFHALDVTLDRYNQETWHSLSLLFWWYSALYFFATLWNIPICKANGMYSWYQLCVLIHSV